MRLKVLLAVATVFLLAACSRYSVSVNDREVYAPETLFTNYQLADGALGACVDQHLRTLQANSADDLAVLNCSNAGIRSVEGLEVFSRIEQLSLADNELVEIDSLLQLIHVEYLDLRGNSGLECEVGSQLQQVINGTVLLPQHCE